MGLFSIFKKNQSQCDIENSSRKEDVVPKLPSRCKYLCSISKYNDCIEKIVAYKLKREFEYGYDSYSIFLDIEYGTMFFVHNTLEHIGAAYDTQVRYATVISFNNVKSLLLYEVDYYKALVERWEESNDVDRANSCKEHLQEIEKIINTNVSDWKELTDL